MLVGNHNISENGRGARDALCTHPTYTQSGGGGGRRYVNHTPPANAMVDTWSCTSLYSGMARA
jgi:hypothetical protein